MEEEKEPVTPEEETGPANAIKDNAIPSEATEQATSEGKKSKVKKFSKKDKKETAEPKAKKKSKKKFAVAGGVCAAIIVVAGAGMLIWHEQPSFCSTLCHNTMNPYYETWVEGDSLAHQHAENDVACLDCHEPTIDQQVSEFTKQVTGDYKTPLKFRPLGTVEFCTKSCHSQEELIAATADYDGGTYNPHEFHGGELNCYNCHRVHEESRLYCSSCHDAMTVPEGWKKA